MKGIAAALRMGLRRPADLLVRYGGEEFMVLLPDTAAEGAIAVANAMKEAVAALKLRHETSSVAPHVTVSIGVASMLPSEGTAVESLIAAADKALYRAKQEGRNRICESSV